MSIDPSTNHTNDTSQSSEDTDFTSPHYRRLFEEQGFTAELAAKLGDVMALILRQERKRWEEMAPLVTKVDLGGAVEQLTQALSQSEDRSASALASAIDHSVANKPDREAIRTIVHDLITTLSRELHESLASKTAVAHLSSEFRDLITQSEATRRNESASKEQVRTLQEALKRIEARLESLDGKVDAVKGDSNEIKASIAVLADISSRTVELEQQARRILEQISNNHISLIKWVVTMGFAVVGLVVGLLEVIGT